MNSKYCFLLGCVLLISTMVMVASQAEGPKWWSIDNRLRVEYDDNFSTTETNEQDSLKIIEQIQFMGDKNFEKGFISLRYQPTFTYWDNRPDQEDVHHEMDGLISYYFMPRLSLSIKDTLRRSELPEVIDDQEVVVRQNNDYFYNSVNGSLSYWMGVKNNIRLSVRNVILQYDEEETADDNDYTLNVGGFDFLRNISKETVVGLNLRYETIDYPGDAAEVADSSGNVFVDAGGDRGSSSLNIGATVNHEFSPNLISSCMFGYTRKEFEAANTDSREEPSLRATVTYLPSPATRMSIAAAHSLYESDVYPYANQVRTSLSLSFAHDFSERLSWYTSGTVVLGDYDKSDTTETVDEDDIKDGEDKSYQFSTRAQYEFMENNSFELGWMFTKLESELREDFDRNRFYLGWRARL